MSFIWGTSFILIKKSLLAYTPLQSGALRISFAFLYFLPFAFKRIKRIKRKHIKPLLVAGFIGNFFPAFMFAYGETKISSTLTAMINSTTPIFVLIVGFLFYKAKVLKINVIGLIIGFIGTIGLIISDLSGFTFDVNIGALIIVLATFFYGINTNELKYKLHDLDGITVSAVSFSFIGLFAIGYFLTTDISASYHNPHFWLSTLSLATLAFFSSFIAVLIFNVIIKYTTAIFAASVTYLIPVFAMFWGLLDGETITILQIISIIIVFSGVSLVNAQTEKKYYFYFH